MSPKLWVGLSRNSHRLSSPSPWFSALPPGQWLYGQSPRVRRAPTAALPLLLLAVPSLLESKPCRLDLLGSPLDTLVINWETLTGSEAQSRRWSPTLSPFSPRSHTPGGGDGLQGCRGRQHPLEEGAWMDQGRWESHPTRPFSLKSLTPCSEFLLSPCFLWWGKTWHHFEIKWKPFESNPYLVGSFTIPKDKQPHPKHYQDSWSFE